MFPLLQTAGHGFIPSQEHKAGSYISEHIHSVFRYKHIQSYCYQTGKQYCILAFPRGPRFTRAPLVKHVHSSLPCSSFLTHCSTISRPRAPLFQGLVCRLAFEQLYFVTGFVVIAPKALATDKVSVVTNCFTGFSFPGLIWVLGGLSDLQGFGKKHSHKPQDNSSLFCVLHKLHKSCVRLNCL